MHVYHLHFSFDLIYTQPHILQKPASYSSYTSISSYEPTYKDIYARTHTQNPVKQPAYTSSLLYFTYVLYPHKQPCVTTFMNKTKYEDTPTHTHTQTHPSYNSSLLHPTYFIHSHKKILVTTLIKTSHVFFTFSDIISGWNTASSIDSNGRGHEVTGRRPTSSVKTSGWGKVETPPNE